MRKLKRPGHGSQRGGRAAVVVPDGTLFGDGVCARVKERLLKEFNLHTIVRLPNGVFEPYTPIRTNVLFFDRSGPTHEIWFYELLPPPGRKKYAKTMPLQVEEFSECLAWWTGREENAWAWRVRAEDVLKYDGGAVVSVNLDIKNPHGVVGLEHLPPEQLMDDMLEKEQRIIRLLQGIKGTLKESDV